MQKDSPLTNLLLIGVCFLLCLTTYSQNGKTIANSFVIEDNLNPEKVEFYKQAILTADLETYRRRDERVSLVFENGFTLQLFSAKELFVQGAKINPNDYAMTAPKVAVLPVFKIISDGRMTAMVAHIEKEKK